MNEDEKELYEERIAIMVIDGKTSEEEAKAQAKRQIWEKRIKEKQGVARKVK